MKNVFRVFILAVIVGIFCDYSVAAQHATVSQATTSLKKRNGELRAHFEAIKNTAPDQATIQKIKSDSKAYKIEAQTYTASGSALDTKRLVEELYTEIMAQWPDPETPGFFTRIGNWFSGKTKSSTESAHTPSTATTTPVPTPVSTTAPATSHPTNVSPASSVAPAVLPNEPIEVLPPITLEEWEDKPTTPQKATTNSPLKPTKTEETEKASAVKQEQEAQQKQKSEESNIERLKREALAVRKSRPLKPSSSTNSANISSQSSNSTVSAATSSSASTTTAGVAPIVQVLENGNLAASGKDLCDYLEAYQTAAGNSGVQRSFFRIKILPDMINKLRHQPNFLKMLMSCIEEAKDKTTRQDIAKVFNLNDFYKSEVNDVCNNFVNAYEISPTDSDAIKQKKLSEARTAALNIMCDYVQKVRQDLHAEVSEKCEAEAANQTATSSQTAYSKRKKELRDRITNIMQNDQLTVQEGVAQIRFGDGTTKNILITRTHPATTTPQPAQQTQTEQKADSIFHLATTPAPSQQPTQTGHSERSEALLKHLHDLQENCPDSDNEQKQIHEEIITYLKNNPAELDGITEFIHTNKNRPTAEIQKKLKEAAIYQSFDRNCFGNHAENPALNTLQDEFIYEAIISQKNFVESQSPAKEKKTNWWLTSFGTLGAAAATYGAYGLYNLYAGTTKTMLGYKQVSLLGSTLPKVWNFAQAATFQVILPAVGIAAAGLICYACYRGYIHHKLNKAVTKAEETFKGNERKPQTRERLFQLKRKSLGESNKTMEEVLTLGEGAKSIFGTNPVEDFVQDQIDQIV